MKYERILFITTLSKNSKEAAQHAREIADKHQAKLDIAHVIENSPIAYGGEFSIPMDVALDHAIESHVQQEITRLSKSVNIPVQQQHLIKGVIKHEVIELANQLQIGLIIIETHEQHKLDAFLGLIY